MFRYIAEGATIILVGLYWLNGIARRNNLSTFDIFPRHVAVSLYHDDGIYYVTCTLSDDSII